MAMFVRLSAALCLVSSAALADETPKVLASIKPVHSIVAAIMKGAGEPALLMDGDSSPHTHRTESSDEVALHNADLIFRIGPDLEAFLNVPLKAQESKATVVDLWKSPGIEPLGFRPPGIFNVKHSAEKHGHDDEGDHAGEEKHGAGADQKSDHEHDHHDHKHITTTFDMHFWLDPDNAGHMARYIADQLIEADPANVDLYQRNTIDLLNRLDETAHDIEALLAPVGDQPFIVYHDAYHYFEARFGLLAAGSLALHAEYPPGAETVFEMKDLVAGGGITCVFTEPQFPPKHIEAIAEVADMRTGVLDPLGSTIEPGPEHYERMIRAIARSLRDCLAG